MTALSSRCRTAVSEPVRGDTTRCTHATAPTWRDLTQAEPRLLDVQRMVRRYAREAGERFCANDVWYPWVKPHVSGLVGWSRKHSHHVPPHEDEAVEAMLRSSAAYDVAYEHLYGLLPACRHEPRLGCA